MNEPSWFFIIRHILYLLQFPYVKIKMDVIDGDLINILPFFFFFEGINNILPCL